MKALVLVASIFAASVAHAGVVLSFPNNSGGKIVLQDVKCAWNPSYHAVRSWAPGTDDQWGCWFYDSSERVVRIGWSGSGDASVGATSWRTYQIDNTWQRGDAFPTSK